MSDSGVAEALFTQGAKVAKALSDENVKQLLSGEAKLAFVPQGQRVVEYTPALDKALKLLQKLGAEDLQAIEDSTAKLAFVPQGQRVVEYTPALDKALKLLQKLGAEDLQAIEDGTVKLSLLRKGEKVTKTFDPDEAAREVIRYSTEGEIVQYLDAEPSLGAPNLKKVASALNLHPPSTVKTKQALQTYIAENVVRDRTRWSLQ